MYSRYKYNIKFLIIFLGWLNRDQAGRGTKTSKGIKEGACRFTCRPSTLRFIPKGNELGFWSTCFPLFSVDMRHGFERTQWLWLPCLLLRVFCYWSAPPQESLQSSDVRCRIGDHSVTAPDRWQRRILRVLEKDPNGSKRRTPLTYSCVIF